ncbi:MAG: hypothetical protein IJC15_04765 [Clostridia bacterium]|nr:hypothetical protein [Clostridia bacterium]
MQIYGSWNFMFEAIDDVLVIGHTAYGYTYEGYTLICVEGSLRVEADFGGRDRELSLWRGDDGSFRYTLHTRWPSTADLVQCAFAVVDTVYSPDDFLRESGCAAVVNGQLVLLPEEEQTIGEVYDLEALLAEYNASVREWGNPEFVVADLDALYARNRMRNVK